MGIKTKIIQNNLIGVFLTNPQSIDISGLVVRGVRKKRPGAAAFMGWVQGIRGLYFPKYAFFIDADSGNRDLYFAKLDAFMGRVGGIKALFPQKH